MEKSSMDITVTEEQNEVPVTVLHLDGNLDALTYLDLIAKSCEIYESGHTDLLLDMQEVHKIGLSGLFALFSIATLFEGEEPIDPEAGWVALTIMANQLRRVRHDHVKLLNPQAEVAEAVSQTGLPTYDSLSKALASFDKKTKQKS